MTQRAKHKEAFTRWWQGRRLGAARQARIDAYARAHGGGPALLLVIDDLGNDEPGLLRTLGSLDRHAPLLANTTLVVLSSHPGVGTGQVREGVYWVAGSAKRRGDALNELIATLPFDWLLRVEAGTEFNADALTVTLLELLGKPPCPAVFCDELWREGNGDTWPILRGNFNLDQLLSVPVAMAGHWLFGREALFAVDGFDGSFANALELDLILRLIEAGQSAFGHLSEPLVSRGPMGLVPCEDERAAVLAHLRRRGYPDAQVTEPAPGRYQIDYGSTCPSVAVVIPAVGPLDVLQHCVAAVLECTHLPMFCVALVETEHSTAGITQWMDKLAAQREGRVLAIRSQAPLGVNRALNGAVEALDSEFLAFVWPGVQVLSDGWLATLMDQALRPEIGIVGPRRLTADADTQEAGLRLGLEGPAQAALLVQPTEDFEYRNVQRNVVAVSGDCMVLSKANFRQVGGFDEERFQHCWADIDLSLKLHWAGYLNLWTPRVSVQVAESLAPTQGKAEFLSDTQAMYAQWGASLGRDPSLSYLYGLRGTGFDLDPDPQLIWRPLAFAGLPVVVGADVATNARIRIAEPLQTLRDAGSLEGGLASSPLGITEWLRLVPATVVLPLGVGDFGLEAAMAQLAPCRICDLAFANEAQLAEEPLRAALAGFDKVVVATQAQASRIAKAHARLEVLPSFLPPALWRGLPSPQQGGRTRVGIISLKDDGLDLAALTELCKRFANEVEWVVYGELPDMLSPWVIQHQPAVEPERYPQCLASLGLHIALVMLEESYSGLALAQRRVAEHGACGSAVIAGWGGVGPGVASVSDAESASRALQTWLRSSEQRQEAARTLHSQVMAEALLEGAQAERWLAAWSPLVT